MEATDKNFEISESIINLLVTEKCTIEQAQSILSYVSRKITTSSTVQNLNETC